MSLGVIEFLALAQIKVMALREVTKWVCFDYVKVVKLVLQSFELPCQVIFGFAKNLTVYEATLLVRIRGRILNQRRQILV